ncbi:MAG: hypothetical protein P1U56_04425 [Saprospiraceae bacterium]|nr:hypothetical protein [Saprospiraceae bacterium]
MKYLVGAVVFIMLFVLPLGSWYYLQTGLDYRKDALKELEPKGLFESSALDINTLKSKTTLMHLKDVGDNVVSEVFDQYGGSQTFQMLSIEKSNDDQANWIEIDAFTANSIASSHSDAGFLLIDTSGQLRNSYPADMDGVRRMIEHTSIILPRIKEMDVKLKK